ncbi:MAG TPA: NAD-dependent succinate-semialdehyde dehydrogenase [Candidatus Aminicenantes bacterium]|nr:NAD-dependent succinate-semialdehyde dehydrogenase [Candidatus Aminicenantes bacterium]
MPISAVNPATGKRIKDYMPLDAHALNAALDRAVAALEHWRGLPMEQRARVVRSAAEILSSRASEWAERMTTEMGKPISQSRAEAEKCAWVCAFYAQQGEKMLAMRDVATDAPSSYVRYDPLGVILGIMPWNFPFWQVFRFAVPAMIAGNAVLLKHASNVPGCALDIEAIWRESGLPPNLFQTLLVDAAAAESLIADPRVAAVSLTGSEEAGRCVAAAAGRVVKKTVLELGGSDAFVVLADADLKAAARAGAVSRTINSGQSCIAAKRFILVESVADDFVELFRESLRCMRVGDPMDEETEVGPLARDDLRRELHRQVEATVSAGAATLLGGAMPAGEGFFYPVTLLDHVTPDMVAAREETFGPVAAVLRVASEKQAVDVANSSRYGLGASLWTRDLDKGHDLAARVEAGAVFVNGMVKSDPRLPFGGIKSSGYGRELGMEGIREFVNIKSVWMDGRS